MLLRFYLIFCMISSVFIDSFEGGFLMNLTHEIKIIVNYVKDVLENYATDEFIAKVKDADVSKVNYCSVTFNKDNYFGISCYTTENIEHPGDGYCNFMFYIYNNEFAFAKDWDSPKSSIYIPLNCYKINSNFLEDKLNQLESLGYFAQSDYSVNKLDLSGNKEYIYSEDEKFILDNLLKTIKLIFK